MTKRSPRLCGLLWAAALLVAPATASAHFLWISVEPAADPGSKAESTVRCFLSEQPEPEGPEFLKHVRGLTLTADGQPLDAAVGEEALEARWVGQLPPTIDAQRDLG